MSISATYISANSFKISGNQTSIFVDNRRVRATYSGTEYLYGTVASSSYLSGYTTVVLDESVLIPSVSGIDYGIVGGNTAGSLPDHLHTSAQGDGGEISYVSSATLATTSGNIVAQIPSDFYSQAEVDTISGAIVAQIPSLSGYATESYVDDHTWTESDITDLDKYTQAEVDTISGALNDKIPSLAGYATESYVDNEIATLSGSIVLDHGGLTGLSDNDHPQYLLDADFTTYSGTLQSQIDGKADTGHTHTESDITDLGDYATNAELLTASGNIVSQIPSLSGYATTTYVDEHTWTESDITDLDKYTQAEVDALLASGTGVTNHSELNELDYLSSGHTGFQEAGDYITSSELLTASGNIVSQIPTDYVSDAEMTTISGDIVAQIPSLAGYATESYVDNEIATLSGSIILDHGGLTGLTDDDHLQYLLRTDFTTYSGAIVDQIPSLTGYATESYVDSADTTLSGILQSEIDGKADTGHTHDDRYYTEGEVDTISGSIVAQIPSLSGYATESYVSDNYIDNSEMTTISGNIVSQIPSIAGLATESYVDTASGTLQSQITTNAGDISDNTALIATTSGSLQSAVDNKADNPHDNTQHSATYITSAGVTYENLSGNSDIGTGSTQVAQGDHTHAQLHDRSHTITSTSDHTAGNWKVIYTDASGNVQELALGTATQVLTSNGASSAPSFEDASGGATTLLELTDTPSSYSSGLYLKSTGVGTEWATASGGGTTSVFGNHTIASGVITTTIVFDEVQSDTSYYITSDLINTVDAQPSIYGYIRSATTVSGFTIILSGYTDSANYSLDYQLMR